MENDRAHLFIGYKWNGQDVIAGKIELPGHMVGSTKGMVLLTLVASQLLESSPGIFQSTMNQFFTAPQAQPEVVEEVVPDGSPTES